MRSRKVVIEETWFQHPLFNEILWPTATLVALGLHCMRNKIRRHGRGRLANIGTDGLLDWLAEQEFDASFPQLAKASQSLHPRTVMGYVGLFRRLELLERPLRGNSRGATNHYILPRWTRQRLDHAWDVWNTLEEREYRRLERGSRTYARGPRPVRSQ